MFSRLFVALILTIVINVLTAEGQQQQQQKQRKQRQRFAEEPSDKTTKVGDRIVLPCRVANREGGVQWTRGDFGLGIERDLQDWPRYRMIEQVKDDWSLEIDPVTLEDDDVFQCQVLGSETSGAIRSRKATITVWVPPEAPVILGEPIKEARETTEVKLECVSKGGRPAAKIYWFDWNGNLLNDLAYINYVTKRMPDESKLFSAHSILRFTPTLEHHNRTYRCEASNQAGKAPGPPAQVTLDVKYSPSVTVTPLRLGKIHEGDKVAYRCSAIANPPPHERSYRWYIEDQEVPGQFGFYYEIFNVSRSYHDKQIKCTVENDLGKAMGIRTIEVEYGPTVILHPQTVAGDRLESVTLHCIVDSNPPPKYHWTKDNSREVEAETQNLTVIVSEQTEGEYYCHAVTPGYTPITTFPAEVLLKGKPRLVSNPLQYAVLGRDAQVNCEAHSVPEPSSVIWKFHGKVLDEVNPHYRIIVSPMQRGVRSTLIVRETLESDFGPYKCEVENSYGRGELFITLESEDPFNLMVVIVTVFAGVILILTIVLITVLCRSRFPNCCSCCSVVAKSRKKKHSEKKKSSNFQQKLNNEESTILNSNILIRDKSNLDEMPSPNDEDSACWEGSDNQDGGFCRFHQQTPHPSSLTTQLYQTDSDLEPEFPPKPDVISTGYVRYGNFARVNPPGVQGAGNINDTTALYSSAAPVLPPGGTSQSVLNVSDPRLSATYGNPHLRQSNVTAPRGINHQYSTFLSPQQQQQRQEQGSPLNTPMGSGGGGGSGRSGLIASSGFPSNIPTSVSNNEELLRPSSSSTPNSIVVMNNNNSESNENIKCLSSFPEPQIRGPGATASSSILQHIPATTTMAYTSGTGNTGLATHV